MERIYPIIAAITALGLVLGLLFEPAITLLTGISFWALLVMVYSGAEDPNPHRTSIKLHGGIPDRPLTKLALKTQPAKKRFPIPARTIMVMFLAGLLLVATGYYWMVWAGA